MSLFRKEALEHQHNRLYGEVRLDTPVSSRVLTGLLSLLFFGLVCFLIFGEYTRKQTVFGWLTPDKGMVRIASPDPGVIKQVHVSEGDRVRAGDRLITLTFDSALADGNGGGESAGQMLLDELQSEMSALDAQLEALKVRYARDATSLEGRAARLGEERDALRRQIAVQTARARLARETFGRYEGLAAENVASPVELAQQRDALLAAEQGEARLMRELAVIEREIEAAAAAKAQLPAAKNAEIAGLTARRASLARQQTEYRRKGGLLLTAPINGRIAAAPYRAGQYVGAQRMLLAILPDDGVLQAELYVPTRGAGFIDVGQRARLRLDAFPHQKFGPVNAQIKNISRTVYNPDELPAPIDVDEPVYGVIARLDAQAVTVAGDSFPLRAGMLLKADLLQEKRRLWRLLQPSAPN